MLKLISNAHVYKAELPNAALVASHLAELPFTPITPSQMSCAGFVPCPVTNELVTTFEGGFAFTVRFDEKMLPDSIINSVLKERVADIERTGDCRLKKAERDALRDLVTFELCQKALAKKTVVTSFYFAADRLLIVPVAGKRISGLITSLLINAIGSVKTETIHVSEIKHGLTTRLRSVIEGQSDAFEGFKLGDSVNLAMKGEKITYAIADFDTAKAGVLEALNRNFQVERIGLVHGDVDFKLTHDFYFRAVHFDTEIERDEAEAHDPVFVWRQEASSQVLQFAAVVNELCTLFGYKEPELETDQAEMAAA